jgi:hypothetical protein
MEKRICELKLNEIDCVVGGAVAPATLAYKPVSQPMVYLPANQPMMSPPPSFRG